MKRVVDLIKDYEDIEVPYEVWRLFGKSSEYIYLAGKQVSLGEDFVSLEQARTAIEYYVNQLGGKVKWEK